MIDAAKLADLPTAAATMLEEFVVTLHGALGDDLDSVILFGSGAEGRLRPTSDLNVLVVARRFDIARLDALRTILRAGRAAVGLTAMFLERSEIEEASGAFALKFADIKSRHRVLYGASLLDEVSVSREAAQRRVQQVLLNLHVRLRERFVIDGERGEGLARLLADATGPIRASAATLLWLREGRVLAPKAAFEELLPGESWRMLREGLSLVHRGEAVTQDTVRPLFARTLEALTELSRMARTC